ncbi:MAG: nicotinate-nucleotide adenylyltransferase [Lachnospiraceae bacterium]|nr:nicotinate-nucleotide adenylyltransferase [Lachnospiraceae bacterium]
MKKTGIMGGTFNPVHNAHIMMAQAAYEQYGLDEVWFMPSKNPPHKKTSGIVSEEHRKRMVQAAIDGIPYFKFSDLELKREGTTYTSDTMEQLRREFPDREFYFILGGDSLRDFDKWHKPEKILKYCKILAAPRGSLSDEEMKKLCRQQGKKLHGEILPLAMNHIQISSEQIRKRIEAGKSVLAYCPRKVVMYSNLHGLYGAPVPKMKKSQADKELLDSLEATLRPKRYMHTLGVAYTASSLAFCHGAQAEEAELAGLLHDCAKYFTDGEMFALCEEYEIELSPAERANTALIHGKLGAALAKSRYGVKKEEILSAIRYHTTGRPAMTLLEKILYAADYIEPRRHMEPEPYSLSEVRKACFENLDQGLLMILTNTLQYLRDSGKEIDERTVETYEYYKKKLTAEISE